MADNSIARNDERKNDLIKYLFNFAYDHDIGYVFFESDPNYPSLSWKNKREIGINMNWHNHSAEVPFTIAHEIGHIMGDGPNLKQFDCIGYGWQNCDEKPADNYGVRLIYEYSCRMEDNFCDPLAFMKAYGILSRMTKETYKVFEEKSDLYTRGVC